MNIRMAGDWAAGILEDLRFHWGDAYVISHPEPDVWLAQRRDSREMLRAEGPDQLSAGIEADYGERPVPREVAPRT